MRKNPIKINTQLIPLLLILAANPIENCLGDDVQTGKYYEKALQSYRNRNAAAAIIDLKNAIQENPNYVAAHILLGEIYLQNKSLSEAEVQLKLAEQLGADKSLLVKSKAQLYLYQMKYDELIKDIDPSQFNREIQADLYVYRGNAYLKLNQVSDALNEYALATQITPNAIEPLLGKANALLLRGDIKNAILDSDKATQAAPENPGVWYLKASLHHVQSNLDEALSAYDKAISLAPDFQDARIARAGLLMGLHQYDKAKADLQFLRENYPFDPQSAYLNAVVLTADKQHAAAAKELEQAAEIIGNIKQEFIKKQPQLLILAGLVNYSLKRFDLAYSYLNDYIKQYPEQVGVYRLLGSTLLAKGEADKAVDILKPVQVRHPNDQSLMFLLGTAYMQVGKHDLANAILEKASASESTNEEVHTELGLNRLMMGQEKLATQELEMATKNNPANAEAGIPLVAMYISSGKSAQALRLAQAMSNQMPKNLTLLNLLGTAQVSARQRQQARSSFEKAIALNPDFITAHINLSKLDLLEKNQEQAKQRLQKLNQKFPDNIALMLELAAIEQASGNIEQSNRWLNQARGLDPKSLAVTLALIDLKLKAGKSLEALSFAQAEEANFSHNIQFQEALARCYLAAGSKDNAINVYRLMSQDARFNTKHLYRIAMLQMNTGDYSEVIKTLKKAVMGDEKHLPSQIALVEMELQYGNPAFALSRAQNLLKQYPQQAFPHRLLGDIAAHDQNFSSAAAHYQASFDLEPRTPSLMKLYQTLKQTDQPDKAYNMLDQWLKKHPKDNVAMAALAEAHLQSGKLTEAQKYYESLLKQYPKEPQFLNNLAYIYLNTGNPKALSYAEQAQKLAPEQAAANDTLGWILVNSGQAEKGLPYLRNAHSRLSQNPEIRYHIGVALDQLQRQDEAKHELSEALKSDRPFNGIDKAKALLEKLNH